MKRGEWKGSAGALNCLDGGFNFGGLRHDGGIGGAGICGLRGAGFGTGFGCGLRLGAEKVHYVCEQGEEAMIFGEAKAGGDSIEIAFEVPKADSDFQIRETGAQFAVKHSRVIEREGREGGNADGVGRVIGDLA